MFWMPRGLSATLCMPYGAQVTNILFVDQHILAATAHPTSTSMPILQTTTAATQVQCTVHKLRSCSLQHGEAQALLDFSQLSCCILTINITCSTKKY